MSIAVSVLTTSRVARNPDGYRDGSTEKQPAVGTAYSSVRLASFYKNRKSDT